MPPSSPRQAVPARALLRQLTHPLAVLPLLAGGLAVAADTAQLAWAIAAVVVINRRLDSPVLVFTGTGCTVGAEAVVHATGAHSEIGRIAALAGRRRPLDSPLERQIRRVALLIAVVAVAVGTAFLPLVIMAGLSLTEAFVFAVGLLVADVPEGSLPTITLALAAGVRAMARRGACRRATRGQVTPPLSADAHPLEALVMLGMRRVGQHRLELL